MPSKPLVSVGIPNFNCAHYIGEAIEGVLTQKRSDGGLERAELVDAFVERDIVDRGFVLLANGRHAEANRFARFGEVSIASVVSAARRALHGPHRCGQRRGRL